MNRLWRKLLKLYWDSYLKFSKCNENSIEFQHSMNVCLCYFSEANEDFEHNPFKIILFALSNAKLPEKYRCTYLARRSDWKQRKTWFILRLFPANHFTECNCFTKQTNWSIRNSIKGKISLLLELIHQCFSLVTKSFR